MKPIDLKVINKVRQGDLTSLEIRLWGKVTIVEDEESCWEWQGARHEGTGNNHGMISFANPDTGVRGATSVHRVVFYVVYGVMPNTARHTCDNPPCARPSHVLDGTQADNIADMDARGRRRVTEDQRGLLNPNAVLTEDLVRVARRLYRQGLPVGEITETLGFDNDSAVRAAINGTSWGHIVDVPPVATEERRSFGGKLTTTQIEEIRTRRAAGERPRDLAILYGVEPSNISYLTRDQHPPRTSTKRAVPFTDEQIQEIRTLGRTKRSYADIGRDYGVTGPTIGKIVRRNIYRHVD